MSALAPVLDTIKLDPLKAGFFRFRRLNGKYLISNDCGRYHLLSEDEFKKFVSGGLDKSAEVYGKLSEDGFIRDQMSFGSLVGIWRKRNRFLWQGPSLHVVIVTLRCNHRCLYCQAGSVPMKDHSCDMSLETARMTVDRIFECPSPAITIEFQGGEPLANWPVVEFVVDYARRKNRKAGKKLWLNLVSNLSLMDEHKLEFLLKRGVNFCTSLDGPAELHNKNRAYVGGNSQEETVKWWKRIYRRTARKMFRIDALLTVTRFSLSRHKEIVDEYLSLGARGIYLRYANPFGLARAT